MGINRLLNGIPKDENLNINFLKKQLRGINVELLDLKDGYLGFSTPNKIALNKNLAKQSPSLFYYTILHELCHYKRFQKYNNKMLSIIFTDDFEHFYPNILNEEIIADRYADRLYYKGNRIKINYNRNLDKPWVNSIYKVFIKDSLFNKIKTIEEYDNFIYKFLK